MADTNPAPAAAPAPEGAPAAAPKKKSNLLVIIIAAVVAALAAGGGAYFFFAGGQEEEEEVADADADADKLDEAADAKGAKKDKKKSKKGKEQPKAPALYVKFDPPFVVNFEAKGLMRFLQVSIEVMTRDQHTADMIKQHDPMLRNDLLMLLGNQTYEAISTLEGKEKLRHDALATVAKVIDQEGGDPKLVEQLYFTSFVMQ